MVLSAKPAVSIRASSLAFDFLQHWVQVRSSVCWNLKGRSTRNINPRSSLVIHPSSHHLGPFFEYFFGPVDPAELYKVQRLTSHFSQWIRIDHFFSAGPIPLHLNTICHVICHRISASFKVQCQSVEPWVSFFCNSVSISIRTAANV